MAFEKRIHDVADVFDDEDIDDDDDDDDDEDDDAEEDDDFADDAIVRTPKTLHRPTPPVNFLSKNSVFDDEDPDDDEDDPHSPSSSSNLIPRTHPPPPSSTPPVLLPGNPLPLSSVPDLKRQRSPDEPPPLLALPAEKKQSAFDDSRRLFQRLWTDEDEMELLQGFLEYTAHRSGASHHHHHDTAAFYDQIRSKLQLDFNKNQLVEKLRRLKKKYRNVLSRITSGKDFTFKSPHEHATFEISRKIWSNTDRSVSAIVAVDNTLEEDDAPATLLTPNHNINSGSNNNNNHTPGSCQIVDGNSVDGKGMRSRKRARAPEKHSILHSNNVQVGSPSITSIVEETVRSCLSPMFKELLQSTMKGGCGMGSGGVSPLGAAAGIGVAKDCGGDERWKKQQILELEVYSKRLELVQEQIQLTLHELRSGGGS